MCDIEGQKPAEGLKCYLIQRCADSINPLQLKPWQLVLPVSIKDGLKTQELNAFTPPVIQRKQRSPILLGTSRAYIL